MKIDTDRLENYTLGQIASRLRELETDCATLRHVTSWCVVCSRPPEDQDRETFERVDQENCCPSCGVDRSLAGIKTHIEEIEAENDGPMLTFIANALDGVITNIEIKPDPKRAVDLIHALQSMIAKRTGDRIKSSNGPEFESLRAEYSDMLGDDDVTEDPEACDEHG